MAGIEDIVAVTVRNRSNAVARGLVTEGALSRFLRECREQFIGPRKPAPLPPAMYGLLTEPGMWGWDDAEDRD